MGDGGSVSFQSAAGEPISMKGEKVSIAHATVVELILLRTH